MPRLPHVFVEIGRFMVSGGLSTIVSFTVFNFLAHGLYLTTNPWLGSQPITAFILASLVGMVVSYRLSRYWTFRHRPPVHADGGRTAFFVINLVTLPLSIFCLWFSRHVLHLTDPVADNIAGNVVGRPARPGGAVLPVPPLRVPQAGRRGRADPPARADAPAGRPGPGPEVRRLTGQDQRSVQA